MPAPRCPTCRGPTTLARQNRHRPFCSERCRLMDLGGWLDGRYAIPGEPAPDAEPGAWVAPGAPAHED